jgi:type IV pilus assembly protein PilV
MNNRHSAVRGARIAVRQQAGVMLLEALLAILIFSIGILAVVGMQATAVQDLSEAKYRSDASFLANQVIADMWSNSTQLPQYVYPGSGAVPAVLKNWVSGVQARLPGSATFPPIITVNGNIVSVTVRWQQSRDSAKGINAGARRYTALAYISCC